MGQQQQITSDGEGDYSAAVYEEEPRPQQQMAATTKEGFGTHEVTTTGEVSQTALAARVTAEVQAACIMAAKFPRNMDAFRVALLENCARKRFAETTRFAMPRGNCQECKGKKKIGNEPCWKCDGTGKNIVRGWTIRFAEAAFQDLRNIEIGDTVVADDAMKRTMRLTLTDFQKNTRLYVEYVTEKTVERKFLRDGQRALSARPNSYGDTVYLLPATEEDFRSKLGSNRSKAFRDAVLRLLPPDIKEDALDKVEAAVTQPDADPLAARKKLVDSFAKVGVKPQQLVEYLGHDLDQCTPAEMKTLREFYAALKDGETTWASIIEDPEKAATEAAKKAADKVEKQGTAGVKEALRAAKTAAGGVQAGTTATSDASAAPTSASAPTDPPAATTTQATRSSLTAETRAVIERHLKTLHGDLAPAAQVAKIDAALGGAGIESWDNVSENMGRDAISALEPLIVEMNRAKKKGK